MAEEKLFENKIKKFLKANDCWFIKYWSGAAFTKAGIPDILCCCNGRFIGIEIKATNGKPSELQLYNLREIDKAGGYAILLYPNDYDLFKKLVEGEENHYEELKKRWEHAV